MIKIAMAWFEPNPKNTMIQTISEAMEFYTKKYKLTPDIVTVNPAQYNPETIYPIRVEPWRYTLLGNIFIGIADDSIL